MSEFVLTGSDVFGRYCRIEQLRYGVPNEMFLYNLDAIADELRDALNGESPDTMDQDEFTAIIERNQR